jgi:hypothetical protein
LCVWSLVKMSPNFWTFNKCLYPEMAESLIMFGELSDIKLKWKHKIKIWSSNIYLNWPWGYSCWQAIFKVVFFYSLFKPKKADESHHMYIYNTIYFCLKPLLLKNHLLTCGDFDTTLVKLFGVKHL